MARSFEATAGQMLGDRLLAALDAGQAAGGDSRGMQSAALLIVREKGGYGGFNDRYCDLRVDDAPNPFTELRRLYNIWKPNALILEGYKLCESQSWELAFARGREALALDPRSGDPQYHLGCYHAKAGRLPEALEWLRQAVALDPGHGKTAAEDSDYTPLRTNPEFRKLTGS
jgi:tetratricopeptide (TPR) repeat protein